jgi:hypothetical protein
MRLREEQRELLLKAMLRNYGLRCRLYDEAIARGVCPCCVGASYGDQLQAKYSRQAAWLKILDSKIAALDTTLNQ